VKISKQNREIIKVSIFLVVLGALVYFYIVYPLGKAKALMGRGEPERADTDSVMMNDPAAYVALGFQPDTFQVETDGLTRLACLRLVPAATDPRPARGTVILVPAQNHNRDSLASLARLLVDSAFIVVTYDQRSSGRSTGQYHGEGDYEAGDLNELVRNLELRAEIVHPLSVVGFALGGDAALLGALEDKRINGVIAVEPFLTTSRLISTLAEKHDLLWFPFRSTLLWWWYNIRSSYAAPFRDTENLRPVACRTLLLIPDRYAGDKEVLRLKELSGAGLLTVGAIPAGDKAVDDAIVSFLITK
jgi:pimeloyl-ACP methyl ester carboxylesterase